MINDIVYTYNIYNIYILSLKACTYYQVEMTLHKLSLCKLGLSLIFQDVFKKRICKITCLLKKDKILVMPLSNRSGR